MSLQANSLKVPDQTGVCGLNKAFISEAKVCILNAIYITNERTGIP